MLRSLTFTGSADDRGLLDQIKPAAA